MISEEILLNGGAFYKSFHKHQLIFEEGAAAFFYHQVHKGLVRMISENELEDKEYIQGVFCTGESFGEPPLFDHLPYPASAIAASSCTLILISKEAFFNILEEHADIHFQLTANICHRLRYKSIMLREITCFPAAHRIHTLLIYYKGLDGNRNTGKVRIKQTRKQIALQSGLRIETVIRAVKEMESQNLVSIENGKIYI